MKANQKMKALLLGCLMIGSGNMYAQNVTSFSSADEDDNATHTGPSLISHDQSPFRFRFKMKGNTEREEREISGRSVEKMSFDTEYKAKAIYLLSDKDEVWFWPQFSIKRDFNDIGNEQPYNTDLDFVALRYDRKDLLNKLTSGHDLRASFRYYTRLTKDSMANEGTYGYFNTRIYHSFNMSDDLSLSNHFFVFINNPHAEYKKAGDEGYVHELTVQPKYAFSDKAFVAAEFLEKTESKYKLKTTHKVEINPSIGHSPNKDTFYGAKSWIQFANSQKNGFVKNPLNNSMKLGAIAGVNYGEGNMLSLSVRGKIFDENDDFKAKKWSDSVEAELKFSANVF